MEYSAESKNSDIAEELLSWFLENGNYDCFTACLFHCYDQLHPDIILELAWRHNILDFAMPYLINVMREYVSKVNKLEEAETKRKEENDTNENKPMMNMMGKRVKFFLSCTLLVPKLFLYRRRQWPLR